MSGVELYLGDCLNILQGMEDNSIGVVVTDPPYGIGEAKKNNAGRSKLAISRDYGSDDWDNERIAPIYINEMLRVGKDQVIFGGIYYSDLLPPSSSWIVWDKHNGKNDFADCELAWTSHKKAVRQIDWMWHGMIRRGNEKRYHPTQKPLGVMSWIIENYTKKDDTILDPFMGSCTTGVACVMLGRKFIGIEKKPEYFNIAETRIKEAQMQLRMPF